MQNLLIQIFTSAFNIMLPIGVTFGVFVVSLWSLPLLVKLIKQLF